MLDERIQEKGQKMSGREWVLSRLISQTTLF